MSYNSRKPSWIKRGSNRMVSGFIAIDLMNYYFSKESEWINSVYKKTLLKAQSLNVNNIWGVALVSMLDLARPGQAIFTKRKIPASNLLKAMQSRWSRVIHVWTLKNLNRVLPPTMARRGGLSWASQKKKCQPWATKTGSSRELQTVEAPKLRFITNKNIHCYKKVGISSLLVKWRFDSTDLNSKNGQKCMGKDLGCRSGYSVSPIPSNERVPLWALNAWLVW